jgi:hypothetical protein
VRYYNINADYTDIIRDDLFDVAGAINVLGAGFQLGYSILIGDVFSIDISFFGAGLDRNNLKLIYTTKTTGFNYASIENDVNEVFEEVPYLKKKIQSEVNPDNLTTRIPFLFPGLRANFSIGVAF